MMPLLFAHARWYFRGLFSGRFPLIEACLPARPEGFLKDPSCLSAPGRNYFSFFKLFFSGAGVQWLWTENDSHDWNDAVFAHVFQLTMSNHALD
jgi:hypothetical protein